MEWVHRASRAMSKAKVAGSGLGPLYKARCADLRAAKKLARAKDADLEALKAENESLRARAEAAEQKLQELLDQAKSRNTQGNDDTCEYSKSKEGSSIPVWGFGSGRG